MSSLSKHHKELDINGIGKCSVPMWSCGTPDGFCDKPAYSHPPTGKPENKVRRRWDGFEWRDDGRYPGYVPALACHSHGGEVSRAFKDGNMYCAVMADFINIQESPCGFGETEEIARKNLVQEINKGSQP